MVILVRMGCSYVEMVQRQKEMVFQNFNEKFGFDFDPKFRYFVEILIQNFRFVDQNFGPILSPKFDFWCKFRSFCILKKNILAQMSTQIFDEIFDIFDSSNLPRFLFFQNFQQ